MSRAYIAPLTLLLLLSCKADEGTGSATSTGDTDTSSGSSSTTSDPTGAPACIPGKSEACTCPGGAQGAQTCKPDGSGFDMCTCDEQPTGSISGDASTSGPLPSTGDVTITTDATTTDATTTDATTGTTDVSTSSSTGPGGACQELLSIELAPADAELSGAWQLAMSMLGEGQIANLPNPMGDSDGSVIYSPDIPCDATWYIWARVIDQGSNDSYFATLDGEPMPPAIFEGDCTNQGNGYKWARLNWRDPMAPACMYVQDPWAPMWTAGVHAIEFSYRESPAIGRILVTNDPDLVPQ